jgi:hypothetical protein
MRKFIILSLTSALLICVPSAFSVTQNHEVRSTNIQTSTDRVSYEIPPAGPGGFTRLFFQQEIDTWNYSLPPTVTNNGYVSVLPPCDARITSECIQEFQYRTEGSASWENAVLSERLNPSMDGIKALTFQDGSSQSYGMVEPDASISRPFGSTSRTWVMSNAKHQGGDQYLLSVTLNNLQGPGVASGDNQKLFISLRAINWVSPPEYGVWDKTENATDEFNMPTNIEYKISIKLGMLQNKISTWYNGRLNNPSISLINGLLSISGAPIQLPLAGTDYFTCNSLTDEKLRIFSNGQSESDFKNGSMCNDRLGSGFGTSPADPQGFSKFDLWEKEINEYGKNTYWSLQASTAKYYCRTNEISGFVSSNAMLYSILPPTFNSITSELSYRIASTHFDRDGNLNKGNFNLVINENYAKCLWNIEPNKLSSARVKLTYSDGTPIVGTSTLKSRDGWLYLNVYNFTFSSPTISIKLENTSPQTPTPTPSPTAIQGVASVKKTTITCAKGKANKQVTAVKPKCPAGYKKK